MLLSYSSICGWQVRHTGTLSKVKGDIVNIYAGPQAQAAAVSGKLGCVVTYIILLLHPSRMVPALIMSAAHWVGDKKVAALAQFARCQEVGVSGEYEKTGTRRRAPDLISGDQRGLPGGKDN